MEATRARTVSVNMSNGRTVITSSQNHVVQYRKANFLCERMSSPEMSLTGRKNCTTMSMVKIVLTKRFIIKRGPISVGRPRQTS